MLTLTKSPHTFFGPGVLADQYKPAISPVETLDHDSLRMDYQCWNSLRMSRGFTKHLRNIFGVRFRRLRANAPMHALPSWYVSDSRQRVRRIQFGIYHTPKRSYITHPYLRLEWLCKPYLSAFGTRIFTYGPYMNLQGTSVLERIQFCLQLQCLAFTGCRLSTADLLVRYAACLTSNVCFLCTLSQHVAWRSPQRSVVVCICLP